MGAIRMNFEYKAFEITELHYAALQLNFVRNKGNGQLYKFLQNPKIYIV